MPSAAPHETADFSDTAPAPALSEFAASAVEALETRSSDWPTQTVATFVYARVHQFARP
jgi:hypothetical protein